MSKRPEVCCVCGKSLAGQTVINKLMLPDGQGSKSDFCSVECVDKYVGYPCLYQICVRDTANED